MGGSGNIARISLDSITAAESQSLLLAAVDAVDAEACEIMTLFGVDLRMDAETLSLVVENTPNAFDSSAPDYKLIQLPTIFRCQAETFRGTTLQVWAESLAYTLEPARVH